MAHLNAWRQLAPQRASRSTLAVQARYGGGGRGDSGLILGGGPGGRGNEYQRAKEARLILPGQQAPARGSGRIVVPDKAQQQRLGQPGGEYLPDDSTLGLVGEQQVLNGPPTLNKYRPPAGFMNESLPEDSTATMDPQEMLRRLQARSGQWHQLAKFIPALNSKGYNSATIDEMTGVTPVEQNKWIVSATVYESVKASPESSAELLAHFNGNGAELLHPFRFLSAERRVVAAKYIVEQNLDPDMCEILARSMKEFERRPAERSGFTEHPADCLAFKYLRDAIECRKREEALQKIELGLKVALTDGARQRLVELLQEDESTASSGTASVAASLITLRLSPDELGVRPVCVVGELGQAQVEDLQAAPRTSQGGAFGIFSIEAPSDGAYPTTAGNAGGRGSRPSTSGSWPWVALPQWRALSMARHPVALTVRDCAAVPAMLLGSKAKSDEDKRRLQGSGMLVCDKAVQTFEDIDPNSWYLGVPEGGRGSTLAMVDGAKARELAKTGALFAAVLFLARPPQKEVQDQGHNLLQL